jgi:hypothetical protein
MRGYDPFTGAFGEPDPIREAEMVARAAFDPVEKEMFLRMLRGVRESVKLSDDPSRNRILRRWEREGLVTRFRHGREHLVGLTVKGEALAREVLPRPEKGKRRSKKGES